MNGKDHIEKMRNSPMYKKMEEIDNMLKKEDGMYDWDKWMKMGPIIIKREEIEQD